MPTIDKQLSEALWRLRGFAILSVATAHCVFTDKDLTILKCMIGTIGVPIFFVMGGFFYNYQENIKRLTMQKVKRIIIPWLIWGLITFIIQCKRGGIVYHNFLDIIKWISGYMTWLYFVPVMLILYVIFYFVRDKYIVPLIIISAVSNYLSAKGMIDIPITIYQNPLNWIGWFAIGVYIKKYAYGELKECYARKLNCKKGIVISSCIAIIIGVLYYVIAKNTGILPSYWHIMAVPFEMVAGVAFLSFSLNLTGKKWLYYLGKQSYAIYFMHFQYGKILTIMLTQGALFNKTGIINAWTIPVASILVCTIPLLTCIFLSEVDRIFFKSEVMWILGIID